jgi:phosphate transport system permease protein
MTGQQIAQAAATQRQVLPRPRRGDKVKSAGFYALMLAALALAMVALATLLIDVWGDGSSKLSSTLIENQPSKINPESSGLHSALIGTLYLMAICAVFVIPLGVATAIYLEEYADRTRWFNRVIELNIQNLAAVPSVVYGILGLAYIVRDGLSLGSTIVAGGLTLGLLVLPVVIIVSREAIRAVPPSIREGALALGATKWQTIWKQVLPGSIAGIATGVILALSRAIGETAPLLLLGAAVSSRIDPTLDNAVINALPLQIFNWSKDSDTANFLPLAAAAIIVLMALLLLMNSIAIYLRNRYEQKW